MMKKLGRGLTHRAAADESDSQRKQFPVQEENSPWADGMLEKLSRWSLFYYHNRQNIYADTVGIAAVGCKTLS